MPLQVGKPSLALAGFDKTLQFETPRQNLTEVMT
jgi:hypothetical protein